MKRQTRLILDLILLFFIILVAGAYFYLAKTYVVNGTSMFPTVHSGERVLVDKNIYEYLKPLKNDVVALIDPQESRYAYIKRVVAVAGDTVNYSFDGIYVNGQIMRQTIAVKRLWQQQVLVVPPDKIFVLGDNREQSYDSRYFGFVPLTKVIGKVDYVVWPPSSFRSVK